MAEISEVTARLLDYVSYDTQSEDDRESIPSTKKQFELAHKLAGELKELGASQVRISEQGYVYACIPANLEEGKTCPSLGFIAHMDTAPSFSGKDVKPQFIRDYDGQDICLNREQDLWMRTADFPDLKAYEGKTLITTDGTTLLGADDKAGIAEIMTMAAYFLGHPEVKHGTICIGFTPDEEVGRGADGFDVDGFGADVAYTVDGGALGELEYENFNAASAKIELRGKSIHPGSAKGQMVNAALVAMELHGLLPALETPFYTENYEGFYHLVAMRGETEQAELQYIIRDHDRTKFEARKAVMEKACAEINRRYGAGTAALTLRDSYYNMKEKIAPCMFLIENAKKAMESLGVTPKVVPIRGGTDGARLSFEGLPCPNLCTGGENFHGRFEYVPADDMETITNLLAQLMWQLAE